MPLYKEDLDQMKCACSDPNCAAGPLYIHSRCHVSQPTFTISHNGVLTIVCSECKEIVAEIAVASKAQVNAVLTVPNKHIPDCGKPPTLTAEEGYTGYFENLYGEQFIFQYSWKTMEPRLWGGDMGWEESFLVVNGQVDKLILGYDERRWLRSVWETASTIARHIKQVKDIKLKDSKFLMELTADGMVYEKYDPETVIKVWAQRGGHDDWAAYFENPYAPKGSKLELGNKLPEDVAKEMFPNWAKKGLTWRV